MSYQRVARDFHQRIDAIAAAVDELAPAMEAAAALIVEAAVNDHRVFFCSGDYEAGIASYMAQQFRSGGGVYPALPVLSLDGGREGDNQAPLWRDLRALSRDGDVILCIDSSDGGALAQHAAALAAERNLPAIILSQATSVTATLLPLSHPKPELRREMALMALHSLHALILQTLMGEEEV